jgi:hypothetical protein
LIVPQLLRTNIRNGCQLLNLPWQFNQSVSRYSKDEEIFVIYYCNCQIIGNFPFEWENIGYKQLNKALWAYSIKRPLCSTVTYMFWRICKKFLTELTQPLKHLFLTNIPSKLRICLCPIFLLWSQKLSL